MFRQGIGMAQLIVSADTYAECEVSFDSDSTISLCPVGKIFGAIPTLYNKKGRFVDIVNSWFFDLKATKSLIDLNSYSRALLSYWNFLEQNQLTWDRIPPLKRFKPTYQYRHFLLSSVKESKIARSTANHYMNHVVSFYIWAIQEGFLKVQNEKEAPFLIQYIDISRNDKFAHMRPSFTVQTTDLRIKVYRDADSHTVTSMNPLDREALNLMAIKLNEQPEEFRLQCLLAVQCGLRISEACSITVDALRHAYPSTELKTRYNMVIGPVNGVKTKYAKERHIEISSQLLKKLINYSISERRLKRYNKLIKKVELVNSGSIVLADSNKNKLNHSLKYNVLFISDRGNPVESKVTSVRWSEFRHKIIIDDRSIKYKFHDLRCTYGTYRLADLLEAGLPAGEALDCLMGWMGHKNEQTTWKYLRFLKRQDVFKVKFALLDSIMLDALKESDV